MDQVTLDKWDSSLEPRVFHVSEVSAIISQLLENKNLQNIWITGEITNFKKHSSGHLYFSLYEQSFGKEFVLSCSVWKSAARYLDFSPDDGMEIRAYGSISHYEPGGRYSFQITQMRPSGAGEKALLIEKWRREMSGKGWFNQERKRILPKYPVRIGVVTSSTGAVIHDIKNVISGRFPVEIILSPTLVQGPSAHEEIARAIHRVEQMVDVLIVGRGGGSNEDLFSFNHPMVVEAIVRCPVPVVTAIGHEVDITLADLAADVRASTPSHAAEQCVPDRQNERDNLAHMKKRMFLHLIDTMESVQEDLNSVRDRLSPLKMNREIWMKRESLVELTDRLIRSAHRSRQGAGFLLLELKARMCGKDPRTFLTREIQERRVFLEEMYERIHFTVQTRCVREKEELQMIFSILHAHGPEALFKRGFSLVTADDQLIRSVFDLKPGALVRIQFLDGNAEAMIQKVYHDKKV